MAKLIRLDDDISNSLEFRYQTLVEVFGKEEADKLIADETPTTLDKDVTDVLDNATDTIFDE